MPRRRAPGAKRRYATGEQRREIGDARGFGDPAVLEKLGLGLTYLSTSDYLQHKHKPGDAESNAFHAEVDRRGYTFGQTKAACGFCALAS